MPNLPDRPGSYRGVVESITLTEGKNEKPVIEMDISLTELYAKNPETGDMTWYSCETKQWATKAWLYPVKKDGTINTTCIDQIKDALGYDPVTGFEGMGSQDFVGTPIGLDIKSDTYQGETRLKVSWLRHSEADPKPKSAAPANPSKWAHLDGELAALATPDAPKKSDDLPF